MMMMMMMVLLLLLLLLLLFTGRVAVQAAKVWQRAGGCAEGARGGGVGKSVGRIFRQPGKGGRGVANDEDDDEGLRPPTYDTDPGLRGGTSSSSSSSPPPPSPSLPLPPSPPLSLPVPLRPPVPTLSALRSLIVHQHRTGASLARCVGPFNFQTGRTNHPASASHRGLIQRGLFRRAQGGWYEDMQVVVGESGVVRLVGFLHSVLLLADRPDEDHSPPLLPFCAAKSVRPPARPPGPLHADVRDEPAAAAHVLCGAVSAKPYRGAAVRKHGARLWEIVELLSLAGRRASVPSCCPARGVDGVV
jgi:hypothetical protein